MRIVGAFRAESRTSGFALAAAVGLLLHLSLASPLMAETVWHVRPDGSDLNCDGLTNAPDPRTGSPPRSCSFQTPQKGVDAAAGGDTVLIHAGSYTSAGRSVQGNTAIIGLSSRSDLNSESTRLTVKGSGDGSVIFDGGDSIDSGVAIWGTSYVTLEGIEFVRFTANTGPSFSYGAAAVNVGSPGSSAPSSFIVLKSLTVRFSTAEHLSGQNAEIAIWCEDCASNTVDSCSIESVEPFGVAIGNESFTSVDQDGKILNNKIVHVRDFQAWSGILARHSSGWTLAGNYFEDASLPDLTSEGVRIEDSELWTAVNNVFYRLPSAGLHSVDEAGDGVNVEGHLFLNNTLDCAGTGQQGILAEGCTGCQVRNNIIVGCSSAVALVGDDSGSQLGFNDLFQNATNYDPIGSGFTLVGKDVLADPKFLQQIPRPDPYYRLQPRSPAINAGDNARCAVTPDDGSCDIGAFQGPFTGNHHPARPSIAFVNNLTGRSARLHGSAFSDSDPGDTHLASQWQVDLSSGDFSAPVKDSGRTTNALTAFTVGGLAAETAYKARVRYQDNHLAWSEWSDPSADGSSQFTTLAATAVPPKVVSVQPAADSVAVLVNVTPELTFNVPIDAVSVTRATVELRSRGMPVTQSEGSPSLDGTGQTVTIATPGLLNPDLRYRIVVHGGSAGVRSRDGSLPGTDFSSFFRTETALASSLPAKDATGVDPAVSPQVTLKWAVDEATANTTTVVLRDLTAGRKVPLSSVSTSADGLTVTLAPASSLHANHKFRVAAAGGETGLRFLDGRFSGRAIRVAFRTQ